MTTIAQPSANVLIDDAQRRQAADLLAALDGHPERLLIESRAPRALPREIAGVLARVVEVMAQGGTVTIGSLPPELTTTVAAEQLGISRPTLMKLIRDGEIPARKVGSHHRVALAEVRAYRRRRLEEQRQAFDALRALEADLDVE